MRKAERVTELLVTVCEHEGFQNAIVLRAHVNKETGFLSIEQWDKDAIELTREQAVALSKFINQNEMLIAPDSDFYTT